MLYNSPPVRPGRYTANIKDTVSAINMKPHLKIRISLIKSALISKLLLHYKELSLGLAPSSDGDMYGLKVHLPFYFNILFPLPKSFAYLWRKEETVCYKNVIECNLIKEKQSNLISFFSVSKLAG